MDLLVPVRASLPVLLIIIGCTVSEIQGECSCDLELMNSLTFNMIVSQSNSHHTCIYRSKLVWMESDNRQYGQRCHSSGIFCGTASFQWVAWVGLFPFASLDFFLLCLEIYMCSFTFIHSGSTVPTYTMIIEGKRQAKT